jgi:hypothetical protein
MRELSVAEQRYQAVLAVVSDGAMVTEVADDVDRDRTRPRRAAMTQGRHSALAAALNCR